MPASRPVRKLAVAMSVLPLHAACSTASHSADSGPASPNGSKSSACSSGKLDIPADASADLKKQYLVHAIAACMKKQGLTYIPLTPDDPAVSWATDGADYKLTKR